MKTNIERLPKSTIKLTVTVENDKVKEAYEKILTETVNNTEIEGFRKGAAPREMIKEKVGVTTLYGDTLNDLLQTYYPQALKENHLLPVSNPKVEVRGFDINKDLEFSATFAQRPEVKIRDYKTALKKYYADKKAKARVGIKDQEETNKKQENAQEENKTEPDHVHLGASEVIDVLLKESDVEVSDMLIEEETDRMMARLTDQLRAINLPVEKYLVAQNKTAEGLRKDYNTTSEKNIKAEFVLSQLIKEENIDVTEEEIDDMIAAVGDSALAEKLNTPMERLYVKTILQKNKIISKLIEDAEGGKHE